jgi:hypothetical protein
VPWNSGGAYQAATLGVPTIAYLPFNFFCWISPIVSMLYGWFNITIDPIDADDAEADRGSRRKKPCADSNAAPPASGRQGRHKGGMQMLKQFNFRLIMHPLWWWACGALPALAADVAFSKDSTLAGIIQRGELRIGLEVGYMPFEMIDTRSGLRQKEIRHGGLRQRGGRQLSLMGFDIDVGIEMAKALGVKPVFVDTLWPSIIPALNLGRFDIIFGGMSVTEVTPRRKSILPILL